MNCGRCTQPIVAGELYASARRRTDLPDDVAGAMDPIVTVHVHPCPTLIRQPEQYAEVGKPTCCGGGPQWGHDWHCPTLP